MQSLCYPARKAGLLISCLLLEECRKKRTCVFECVCVCTYMLLLFGQSCLLFATPWTAAPQASLPFTISQSLLKLMCIEPVMPSNFHYT